MFYRDIIGQKTLLHSIKRSIADDSFSHATILNGTSGYGPLPIALAAAGHLLCPEADNEGPCMICSACKKVERLIHPDLHFSFPVVKKEGKTRKDTLSTDFLTEWRKAMLSNPYLDLTTWLQMIATSTPRGDINVSECNNIIQKLNLRSFGGHNKVQIIWMAELLGSNSNRLLKLIEEPPPDTYLILVTQDLDSILQTIQSRCRLIRVPKVSFADMCQYIQSAHKIKSELVNQVALLADGNIDRALDFVNMSGNALLPLSMSWLDACFNGDISVIKAWVEDFENHNSEEKKAVIHYMIRFFRELLRSKYLPKDQVKLDSEEFSQIRARPYLVQMDLSEIDQLTGIFSENISLLDRNVNSKILFFNTSLKMQAMLNQ